MTVAPSSPSSSSPGSASSDRVALVVGASRGLGLLMARDLLEQGYRVVIAARNDQTLRAAAADLDPSGARVLHRVADAGDPESIADLVAFAERQGSLDVVVHVAGIIQVGPLAAMNRGHFREAIDIMTWGPINVALAAVPGMRARGHGRIGIVTSLGGKVSAPHLVPYSTAKFGAVGFTQGLAAELAGTGVTATTLVPGLMRTGSHLQAQFVGDVAKEYRWFALSATLPFIAMTAERAAHKMVAATLAGKPVAAIGVSAQAATRFGGLAPSITVRGMGIFARLLPRTADSGPHVRSDDATTVKGQDARRRLASPLVNALTGLGDRAAKKNLER
ncbi:ketoacyl reductase [Tersicoccus solisilvae]|uniref:Ketoacyl reductase n=1 Tax=Tersicoccus solisilvae TaxID=1882339 RepID=A0ABQ1PI84_9MICC|nr:SDR family NAD(P)-dependent oxidoreductase [Tersicoccus solisilvae]GGC97328.1 ketoacyl reductase [Tersicoccus solisilvae]